MGRKFVLFILLPGFLLLAHCKKEPVEGVNDNRALGASANDLLSSSRYSTLQIEIQYMPGYEPDAESLNNLSIFLNNRINKPGGIRIAKKQIPASSLATMSLSDVVSIERSSRYYLTNGNTISVYILITNSYYSEGDILATAYWNTAFCIFGKAVDNNSGAPDEVSRSVLMTTLLEHEFGHLLGLVDLGSPMATDHKDSANGAHCSNPDCLMYYNVEAGFTDALESAPALDANCLADLKANGGK